MKKFRITDWIRIENSNPKPTSGPNMLTLLFLFSVLVHQFDEVLYLSRCLKVEVGSEFRPTSGNSLSCKSLSQTLIRQIKTIILVFRRHDLTRYTLNANRNHTAK